MFRTIIHIVIYLSLAVLIGGGLLFGIGVASAVFQTGALPDRMMAGALNSLILRRLGLMDVVAAGLLFGGTIYAAFAEKRWMNWGAMIFSVGVFAVSIYISAALFPKMDALRVGIGNFDRIATEKLALKDEFDSGHKLYSTLTGLTLLGAIAALILNTVGLSISAGRKGIPVVPSPKATPPPAPKSAKSNGEAPTSPAPASTNKPGG